MYTALKCFDSYLGAHGCIGRASMEVHSGVVKSVAASFVVGAIAFVAMKGLFVRHRESVDENDEEEKEEEEEEGVTSEQPAKRAQRWQHRGQSHRSFQVFCFLILMVLFSPFSPASRLFASVLLFSKSLTFIVFC